MFCFCSLFLFSPKYEMKKPEYISLMLSLNLRECYCQDVAVHILSVQACLFLKDISKHKTEDKN